jgi:hypothetical protein
MDILEQNLKEIRPKRKSNVKRNDKSYADCLTTTTSELERLLELYRTTVFDEDMRARLLRDSIDHHIRRYHGYAIQGKINSHYHQRGVSLKAKDTIFEHVIPAAQVRDLLIENKLSINQALNVPTCRVSRKGNSLLNARGMHDRNTDPWNFFKRYKTGMTESDYNGNTVFPEFEAYNGQRIPNLDTWTLRDHFNLFGIV